MESPGNWQTCPRCKARDMTDFSTCKSCGSRYDARVIEDEKTGFRLDERAILVVVIIAVGVGMAVQFKMKQQANAVEARKLVANFQASGKPKVIEFYADWCGPCRAYGPVVDAAAKKYGDKVFFARLNVDEPANQAMARAFDVSAIPRTFFIDTSGKTVDELRGAASAAELEKHVEKLAAGG